MSNWPSPATTHATILDEWYFSPRLHPTSLKHALQNQISLSSPNLAFTNDAESGSKLFTPSLLSHLAIPVFSRPSIEPSKSALTKCINTEICRLAPHLNMHLQNGHGKTETVSQSLCLPSTSSNEEGSSKNKKTADSTGYNPLAFEGTLI
ncbi:hypothetical protein LOAG_08890 [Loa loa]|uniref:Mediator of RNA polymerase II transcription subunit 13 n=1 Tax=Loa loa TaxID=7209 RepID=A0A1I7VIP3_LOALO|nr:hypothetical protein LOAG_08890 [Loa loa]EFO19602.1 hypothetical protein LOAG_08890 [Loa loa]